MLAPPPPILPGHGILSLQPVSPGIAPEHATAATFSVLQASYPLKFLSPRSHIAHLGAVYLATYGGGLVGGDRIAVKGTIGEGCALLLLTQGTTKVFKTRPSLRRTSASTSPSALATTQTLDLTLSPYAAVYILPSPITCFASASYTQTQAFHLAPTSSAVVLDWVTSGREFSGDVGARESWQFARYESRNEFWVGGKLVLRDVLSLKDAAVASLVDTTAPYTIYATLLLHTPLGSHTHALFTYFQNLSKAMPPQRKVTKPPRGVLWSFSDITRDGGSGERAKLGVVRMAGIGWEEVRDWLEGELTKAGAREMVGVDLWRAVWA